MFRSSVRSRSGPFWRKQRTAWESLEFAEQVGSLPASRGAICKLEHKHDDIIAALADSIEVCVAAAAFGSGEKPTKDEQLLQELASTRKANLEVLCSTYPSFSRK